MTSRTSHGVRGLKFYFRPDTDYTSPSHLSRGAWIEIQKSKTRGEAMTSHLSRGAWIEIGWPKFLDEIKQGRTSHGVRGLKSHKSVRIDCLRPGRTSHGVRGLKLGAYVNNSAYSSRTSHGVRGLKSPLVFRAVQLCPVAPLTGCVD